jgi:hypothetical protein
MSDFLEVWILTDDEKQDIGPRIEHELGEAFAQVFSNHETSMVIKWTALVETMDDKGERGLWTFASENNKAWDTLGMLQHAIQIQHSQTLADMYESSEHDD